MREIKFRGKSIENKNIGEWVVGDLHLRSPFAHIHTGLGTKCKIDPNTVGQFTGLKDKNTKDIYEGDIVIRHGRGVAKDSRGVVLYQSGQFVISMLCPLYYDIQDIEVIGNIHDNPELLKSL